MKKYTSMLALGLTLVSLAACSTSNNSTTSSSSSTASSSKTEELKASFVIIESGDKQTKKEVSFTKDQTIMDVMKKEFKIEESNGIITSIDGVSQDEATKTYWMYKVNGEMAPKLAGETKLAAGDTVEFYLEKF